MIQHRPSKKDLLSRREIHKRQAETSWNADLRRDKELPSSKEENKILHFHNLEVLIDSRLDLRQTEIRLCDSRLDLRQTELRLCGLHMQTIVDPLYTRFAGEKQNAPLQLQISHAKMALVQARSD